MITNPVFNAESNGAIGGLIFLAATDLMAVTSAASFFAKFKMEDEVESYMFLLYS